MTTGRRTRSDGGGLPGHARAVLAIVLAVIAGVSWQFAEPALSQAPGSHEWDPSKDPVFIAGLEEAEATRVAWETQQQTPQAKQERVASRSAHRGESGAVAVATDQQAFPAALTSPVQSGLPLADGQHVLRYLNDSQVQLNGPEGHGAALTGSQPLAVRGDDGTMRPVDLHLQTSSSGFAGRTVLSGARVEIPRRADGTITFLDAGFGVSVDDSSSVEGAASHDRVIYANSQPDVDAVVQPIAVGAEISWVLRSPDAGDQTLRFALPDGATLRLATDSLGSLNVSGAQVMKAGHVLANIPAASAVDAQGRPLRVRYSLDGNDGLTVHLANRDDVAWPVLVDPQVASWAGNIYGNWSTSATDPAHFHWSDNNGYAQWQGDAPYAYAAWSNSRGIYASISGAYIYQMHVGGIYHYPNNSIEFGGINDGNTTWAPGSWHDSPPPATGPDGGTPATRNAALQEGGASTDYCAGQNNPTVCGSSNPPPAHGTVAANNQFWWGLFMSGPSAGYPAQYIPTVRTWSANVLESDDVTPSLTVNSHANLPTGWVQSFTDTVSLTGSVPTGLGMFALSISGPGVSENAHTNCSSYPCPLSQTASLTYDSSNMPDGNNSIGAVATNAAINISPSQSWNVKLDTNTPGQTMGGDLWTAPGGAVTQGPHTLTVTSTDSASGVTYIQSWLTGPDGLTVDGTDKLTTNPSSPCDGCPVNQTNTIDMSNLEPGQYTINVQSDDFAGNRNWPIATKTITLVSTAAKPDELLTPINDVKSQSDSAVEGAEATVNTEAQSARALVRPVLERADNAIASAEPALALLTLIRDRLAAAEESGRPYATALGNEIDGHKCDPTQQVVCVDSEPGDTEATYSAIARIPRNTLDSPTSDIKLAELASPPGEPLSPGLLSGPVTTGAITCASTPDSGTASSPESSASLNDTSTPSDPDGFDRDAPAETYDSGSSDTSECAGPGTDADMNSPESYLGAKSVRQATAQGRKSFTWGDVTCLLYVNPVPRPLNPGTVEFNHNRWDCTYEGDGKRPKLTVSQRWTWLLWKHPFNPFQLDGEHRVTAALEHDYHAEFEDHVSGGPVGKRLAGWCGRFDFVSSQGSTLSTANACVFGAHGFAT
jgi:hypothetical protein